MIQTNDSCKLELLILLDQDTKVKIENYEDAKKYKQPSLNKHLLVLIKKSVVYISIYLRTC